LKEDALADARLRLTVVDYLNTYYGRLAARRLAERGVRLPERPLVVQASTYAQGEPGGDAPRFVSPPANAAVVRALLSAGLFDQALDELKYAQNVWGDSSVIQATMAWTYLQQGRSETGGRQLALWRGAINSMKRAYPQFMATGGEDVPSELLRVIFPMAYWDLIRKYAAQYDLDPYLAAALIAQESTFVADIRSSANAVGLTQLLPSTARQYARTLKVRYASSVLTNPESNVQIGLFYLSEKIKEFGQLYLALASYNAGERPVRRWISERPGLSAEEFIDDIPYPQTQNYVKKILGTADDYRRLYSSDGSDAAAIEALARTPSASAPKSSPKKTAAKPTPKKKKPRRAV
jgi:soluble lytic murein transglycosylase